jgi:hypothetical protein
MKKMVMVPEEYVKGDMAILEALEWCTSEVLRLDEENQRLRSKLEKLYARTTTETEGSAK